MATGSDSTVLVADEVLAGMYVTLVVAAAVGLSGRHHAVAGNRPLVQIFSLWVTIGTLRAVSFAVPAGVWAGPYNVTTYASVSLVPRGSTTWGLLWLRLALLVVPNWALLVGYVVILQLWHTVHCIVWNVPSAWPRWLLAVFAAAYGAWQACVLGLYPVLPFPTVMLLQDAMNAALTVGLAAFFGYFWRSLYQDLRVLARNALAHDGNASSISSPAEPLLSPGGGRGRGGGSGGDGGSVGLSDGGDDVLQAARSSSARVRAGDLYTKAQRKIQRISIVCAICLICLAARAIMEIISLGSNLAANATPLFTTDGTWLASSIYFGLADALSLYMIYVLRRPPPPGEADDPPCTCCRSCRVRPRHAAPPPPSHPTSVPPRPFRPDAPFMPDVDALLAAHDSLVTPSTMSEEY